MCISSLLSTNQPLGSRETALIGATPVARVHGQPLGRGLHVGGERAPETDLGGCSFCAGAWYEAKAEPYERRYCALVRRAQIARPTAHVLLSRVRAGALRRGDVTVAQP